MWVFLFMTAGILSKDQNFATVMGAVSSASDTGATAKSAQYDPNTRGITVHIVGSDVSTSDGALVDGANSAIKATVFDYTNANPLSVRLTDSNGDYVAAGAGTQYTEDAASAANPVGSALIVVREDARAGNLTTTDGDNVAVRGNNKGEMYVKTTDSDALLTTIDADTSTLAGAVSGSEMQVDIVSGTVTANLSAVDNAVLDDIAADTEAIKTSLAGTITVTGGGGGIQYTEGDTDATITGTAIMWEDAANTLTPVSSAKPLPVSATIDTTGLATTTTDTNTGTIAGDTTSIDAKIPALGQALAAASVPVVLTAAQITTLTPPAAITGFATSAKQDTIIGHVDGIEALLTTIDADTSNISTKIDTLAGAVAGTEVQVDVLTMPTTTVTATNLDIRDLSSVSDSVTADTELTTADLDTGAGTDTRAVVGLVGSKSGGGELIPGSATDGLLVNLGTNNDVVVTATDLDIRPLVNTDVVTAELSAVDNAVLDTIAAKDFATQTTLAAINTKLVTGTDIGDVTINNSTGAAAVNIQDGGNTITVDGTVAVTNAGITTIAGAVAGTEMQVDVLTMPTVTVDLGVNNDVTVTSGAITETNSGAIKTAVEVIDNAISGSEMQVDVVAALPAGTNAIGKLAANSGVDIGDVDVTSISAGTNLIGDVGIQPRTTNGLDTFMASGSDGSSILVATAQAVKASAGKVYGYYLYNPESAVTFVHFYNTASGGVTVGTTSPLFTLQIPPASAANLMSEIGITFGTAITIAATTTAGGNTAPATGVSATIWYK